MAVVSKKGCAISYKCDNCSSEVKPKGHNRLRRRLGRFEVEAMLATEGVWNKGLLCDACFIAVICEGQPVEDTE